MKKKTGALIIFTISACCMWQTLVLTLPNSPCTEVWSRPQVGDFLPLCVPMTEVIEKSKVSKRKTIWSRSKYTTCMTCGGKRKARNCSRFHLQKSHGLVLNTVKHIKTSLETASGWMYDTVPLFQTQYQKMKREIAVRKGWVVIWLSTSEAPGKSLPVRGRRPSPTPRYVFC